MTRTPGIVTKLRTLSRQDFIRHNFIFLVGTLLVSFFSYLYYPVVGHLVSVREFGEIQAWISLFMEFGIVLTAFGYVTTNIVRNHAGKASKEVLLSEIERLALIVSVIIFFALWASSYYLRTSFKFTSFVPFVALGLLIVLNVPAIFRTYYLQGQRRLKDVAVSGIIFAVGKLVISALFIMLGFKLLGVVAGFILAQLLTLQYVAYKTRGQVPPVISSIPLKLGKPTFVTERAVLRKEVMYGLYVLVLLAVVTILYTSDAIIVRRYFDPQQSGLYSGISSIARIVYYASASVAGVLIATVKINHAPQQNRVLLIKSLTMVLGIGGSVLVAFLVLPNLLTSLLIGSKYTAEVSLLPWVALSMLIASVNNLIFSYQIALRKFSTVLPAIFGLVLLAALVLYRHETLLQIVINYLLANLIICITSVIMVFCQSK